jgi:hypothetical protein
LGGRLGSRFRTAAKTFLAPLGGFGTTKKPGLPGSSDTRSTPENELKIPEPLFLACHQLWGHSSAQPSLSRADKLDEVAIRIHESGLCSWPEDMKKLRRGYHKVVPVAELSGC